MTTSWHSYPKIYALGHAALDTLLNGPVIVEEKIDGSQFSFGNIGGELRVRSRGREMSADAPESLFTEAVEVVKHLPLREGWTYRAEYLRKPKHNVLCYERIPTNHLMIFDINTGEEHYLSPSEKAEEAAVLGLECVPLLYEGLLTSAEQAAKLLTKESILGRVEPEGIVVKAYGRYGADGKTLMGKYVREAFKETHKIEWKSANPQVGDIIKAIRDALKTEARWEKAVQRMRDSGTLQNAPQDIGPLLKEINYDVKEECEAEIKERLFKWAWPQISRGLGAGLPEWYKAKLFAAQFEKE